jgi:hypothetical protein
LRLPVRINQNCDDCVEYAVADLLAITRGLRAGRHAARQKRQQHRQN